jgi:glutamate/tyrosine decarboxylase-like PLP-dependent enzyme
VNEPVRLSDADLRALGHRVVDLIADHWQSIRDVPPIRVGEPAALRGRLAGPAPETGAPPDAVLDELVAEVLPFVQHGDHPRFFARIPGPSNPVGVFADALAAGLNVFVGSWTGGSGPATVELVTLGWLSEIFGLPPAAEGAFVSGGSVATLNALAAARAQRLQPDERSLAIAYLSDQTHASCARALRTLGFTDEQIRVLPTGADLVIQPEQVAAAVNEDRAAGRVPFCVIATAGTTNTGAVDPLAPLADLCADERMWLHVDAAYGGPAAICDAGRSLLAGIERADSIAIDPHKWLFQPYECGVVLVRHPGALASAFALHPEYLADVTGGSEQVNFFDRGVQLTRGFRALKLWMTIKVYGLAAIRSGIEHGIRTAERAEELLRAAGWEIETPAQLGIVSFRRGDDAERHLRTVSEMQADGVAAISSTVLHGVTVLRMCTINPGTSEEDLALTVDALERAWSRAGS